MKKYIAKKWKTKNIYYIFILFLLHSLAKPFLYYVIKGWFSPASHISE